MRDGDNLAKSMKLLPRDWLICLVAKKSQWCDDGNQIVFLKSKSKLFFITLASANIFP